MANDKIALIAGASGLVGSELFHILLESSYYTKVKVVVRKQLDARHPKLEQILVDFDHLEQWREHLFANDVYCCLGTTIKKAGSQEAFRKVDYEYPVKLALLAKEQGAERYLIVSALGANPESRIFYSRTKGQMEEQLKKAGLSALHIFQPSLLMGERSEFRLGEKLAAFLSPVYSPLMVGKFRKYKPVSGRRVAAAMHNAAQSPLSGVFVYPSDKIVELSRIPSGQ